MDEQITTALDLGTTKIICLVGEAAERDKIKVIGWGKSWKMGFKAGYVVDITEAARSVAAALRDAEGKVDFPIHNALIGIAGSQIHTFSKQVWVALGGESRMVTEHDLKRLRQAIEKVGMPADHKTIQILPRTYLIDGITGVTDPMGMVASRLGVEATIITSTANFLENLNLALEKAALEIENCTFVLQGLALGEYLLTPEEKSRGVVLLDIGGEISQLVTFKDDKFYDLKVRELGGNLLSQEMANTLDITFPQAEDLKRKYSTAAPEELDHKEDITLPSGILSNFKLAELTKFHLIHLVKWLKEELEYSHNCGIYPQSLVLTGGGALLKGLRSFLQSQLNLPTRLAETWGIQDQADTADSLRYHSALGLLFYGVKSRQGLESEKPSGRGKTLFNQFKHWLEKAFS